MDAGEQLVRRRVQRRAAGQRRGAQRGEQLLHALARRRPRRRRRPRSARRAAPCAAGPARACRRRRGARPRRRRRTGPVARSGSSVWTWTFSVRWSPTTSTESPIASSASTHADGIQPLAGDGEVRAVAVGRGLVLRVRDARRRVVVELRRLGAAQRGDHAGEDHGEAEAAGVDHAGLAQDGQQLGPAPDRLLAGVERTLEHLGDQRVLALGVALAAAAAAPCGRARRRRGAPSRARR